MEGRLGAASVEQSDAHLKGYAGMLAEKVLHLRFDIAAAEAETGDPDQANRTRLAEEEKRLATLYGLPDTVSAITFRVASIVREPQGGGRYYIHKLVVHNPGRHDDARETHDVDLVPSHFAAEAFPHAGVSHPLPLPDPHQTI